MPNFLEAAKRRISDAVENPGQYAEMLVDQLRNYNAEVVPTAAGGELTNRPMTQDERNTKYMDLAQAAGPGSLKNVSLIRSMLKPGSEAYQRVLAGEHPEKVFQDLYVNKDILPSADSIPLVGALRYETSRPLFDKGIAHYDVSGGKQLLDIMSNPFMTAEGDDVSKSTANRYIRNSQIRRGDLSKIPEDAATVAPEDDWLWGGKYKDPKIFEFYPNALEGGHENLTAGMPTPKVRDVLNDPALREAYNMSLAVPSDSDFHRLAEILRSK